MFVVSVKVYIYIFNAGAQCNDKIVASVDVLPQIGEGNSRILETSI